MAFDTCLPDEIKQVIAQLEGQGNQAWLVGGSIRDCLLGQRPKDWDVVAAGSIQQIEDALRPTNRVLPLGAHFGTITVIFPNMECQVSALQGNDLAEDLGRRDFTVNAIAWHPRWGMQDPYRGQQDLVASRLRCPGPAPEIFRADPLRMLRAVRFAAQLDFRVDMGTWQVIKGLHYLIRQVSSERVRDELSLILTSPRPGVGIDLMRQAGLVAEILPELEACVGFDQRSPHHHQDVYQHTLTVVDNVPADLTLRLAALFHDIGKPSTFTVDSNGVGHFYGHQRESVRLASDIMARLRYDNTTKSGVKKLVGAHMQSLNYPQMNPAKLLAQVGKEHIQQLFALQQADAQSTKYGDTGAIDKMRQKVAQALAEKRPFSRADLAINGHDLLQLGYDGPEVGDILAQLLATVLENPQLNTKKHLLQTLGDGSQMSNQQ